MNSALPRESSDARDTKQGLKMIGKIVLAASRKLGQKQQTNKQTNKRNAKLQVTFFFVKVSRQFVHSRTLRSLCLKIRAIRVSLYPSQPGIQMTQFVFLLKRVFTLFFMDIEIE